MRLLLIVAVILLIVSRDAVAVIFKRGINLALAPEMTRALPLIDQAHIDANIKRGTVVTSGVEGPHKAGSLHFKGLAVDLRTKDLSLTQRTLLVSMLRKRLNGHELKNKPYQVVPEATHLHVEFDPGMKAV